MGAGWRRFSENLKQRWHIADDHEFQSTPNTRNEMMLKEAGEFANHLKRCEKDIRILKNATEGLLNTTKAVMSAPLPRVYDETGGGKVVPVNASQGQGQVVLPIGGVDFNAEELAKISKETGKKLESEVLAPMERWMNAYNLVVNRMKKLEALRLEVDSRRRTVSKLGKKVDIQRARLPQTRAKGEYEMENTIKILQHKESKLSACRQSFKEHEALVYHQLTNLIRDTVWLKSYLSAVLRVEAEAFQYSSVALGQMKADMPAALPDPAMVPSVPATPDDSIPAGNFEPTPPGLQANINRKLSTRGKENGTSMSAATGSKDSLYTVQDPALAALPAAPAHRIAAGSQQMQAYDRYGDAYSSRNNPSMQWC